MPLKQLIRECHELDIQLHKRELLSTVDREWYTWNECVVPLDEATHFSFGLATPCDYGSQGLVATSNLHSLKTYLNINQVMFNTRHGYFGTEWLCIAFDQFDEDNAVMVIENLIHGFINWPIFNDEDYEQRVHEAKSIVCNEFMRSDCPEDLLDFEEEASQYIMEHATEQDCGEYWIDPDDVIEHLRGLNVKN
jgi:hypothetical protein